MKAKDLMTMTKYIGERFPNATDDYIHEWVERFISGNEFTLSDMTGKGMLYRLDPEKYRSQAIECGLIVG